MKNFILVYSGTISDNFEDSLLSEYASLADAGVEIGAKKPMAIKRKIGGRPMVLVFDAENYQKTRGDETAFGVDGQNRVIERISGTIFICAAADGNWISPLSIRDKIAIWNATRAGWLYFETSEKAAEIHRAIN